jgi:hypothetical protein
VEITKLKTTFKSSTKNLPFLRQHALLQQFYSNEIPYVIRGHVIVDVSKNCIITRQVIKTRPKAMWCARHSQEFLLEERCFAPAHAEESHLYLCPKLVAVVK